VCQVLGVSRSCARYIGREHAGHPAIDEELAELIKLLINRHPTYGYRFLWAMLRAQYGIRVNRKKVYRILKVKKWFVHQRQKTPRPRAQRLRSVASHSNERWAMDVTHVPCGRDGWAHLVAVIDCHDRELVGWEFALRGRAREAERAIEAVCITRFGVVKIPDGGPTIRSDNGLIFQSKRFRAACRFYRLDQEFITPYTPEQNGLIERFFRTLKEECVWQLQFETFDHARRVITRWIEWYNQVRPHQALGYLSPTRYRAQQGLLVA
jgi:putative transposase